MTKITVRYFVRRPRDNGTIRHYWQPDTILRKAGWKMERLSDIESEAIARAQAINENVDQWRANRLDAPVNEKPGTMAALIVNYKASRHYRELADRTRKDYAHYLILISNWAGDQMAVAINAKMVQNLYETLREKKPRKAAYLIQVLRLLFTHAERESIIPKNSNPATRPGLDYKAGKGIIWTQEAVMQFVKTADAMNEFTVGTAIMLNEWLGQRPNDLVKLSIKDYRNGCIHITQGKTKSEVILPVDLVPALKARIEAQLVLNAEKGRAKKIAGTTLIQQTNGQPFTLDGFMSAFDRVRKEAATDFNEFNKLVFRALRHTAVTRLAEAGCTIPMIATITGHSFKTCQEIVDRYNIRTTLMAQQAFQRRIDAEAAAVLKTTNQGDDRP